MFYLIKESFKITNKYLAFLVTPLVLFSFFSSLYIIFSMNGTNNLALFSSIILFFMMLGAFISGWFYMVYKCVKNSNIEDVNSLIMEFPSGVGEYFIPFLICIINILVIISLISIGAHIIGMHYIGDLGVSADTLKNAQTSIQASKEFFESLSPEQTHKFILWSILSIGTMLSSSFILLFYSPVIFFKNKNPFKALLICIKDIFSRKFFKNLLLFITIFITYFILSIISGVFSINMILHFISTLMSFYYTVFIAILVYNYYYSNYIKIGSNIDTSV